MNFNSWSFVLFFLIVFAISAPMRRYSTLHKWALLIASWYFYGSWNWQYLGLILFSTVFDYWIGHRFGRTVKPKRLITISVIVNLGVLAFFKYANFAIASANDLADVVGAGFQFSAIDILLPVGISFYTFQSMSYTIDVYRGELAPRKSLLDYALFIAFFPQLVAGPIVRASEFFAELDHPKRLPWKEISYALILIALGFVKKVVLADSLAEWADPIWAAVALREPAFVLAAVYSFAFQIYFDFSGYTDIAIGIALLMGFRFPQNFNYPYAATSLQDFWRRWHMTLSRWLRDYLYIPLGGNRYGPTRTQVNLLLTMLLGGLWHGASWNFVIWGGIHGLWLAFERLLLFRIPGWNSPSPIIVLLRWLLTFHVVCFAWIFFRAPDLPTSLIVIEKIGQLLTNPGTLDRINTALFGFLVLLLLHVAGNRYALKRRIGEGPLWLHSSVMIGALAMLYLFAPSRAAPFLYFQF
ncbi:MBOAT family protein [Ahniella affigens]|uniref:Probable alginate O-acetylase n=1 Tax=Ahniella affigens TaxID=2021234 RepID=A0A2P1PW20_9GAMM|nr:MBOAT family protein [Ahniella affigens]AVP99022.1 MBOAT family protein [Ahniella affigens]